MSETRRHEGGFAWYASDACGDETEFGGETHRCRLLSGHEGSHRDRTLTWGIDTIADKDAAQRSSADRGVTGMTPRVDIDRLAAALWNMERFPDRDDDMPAFRTYADGLQEGCPLHEQDDDFKEYWRNRARRVLRAVWRASKRMQGSGRAPTTVTSSSPGAHA